MRAVSVRNRLRSRSHVAFTWFLFFLPAIAVSAQATQPGIVREVVTDRDGSRLVRSVTLSEGPRFDEARTAAPPYRPERGTRLPDRYLESAEGIPERCALTAGGFLAVVGWWLDNPRTRCYYPSCAPVWTHSMPAADSPIWVDAGSISDQMISAARGESLHVFRGETVRTRAYPPPFVGSESAISGTGLTYVAATVDSAAGTGQIMVYDQSGDLRFVRNLPATAEGINVSKDGLVVVANTRATCWIWNAMTGALRGAIPIPGETQVPAVLSGDGRLLVTGGFDHTVRVYSWNGTSYAPLWESVIPGTTWITALAISADGWDIIAGTWTDPSGGKVVLYRYPSPIPLWTDDDYVDLVSAIATSRNGSYFSVGSWGGEGGAGRIFALYSDRSPIPSIDLAGNEISGVGSCLSIDMADYDCWGEVVFTGKTAHARVYGNTGYVMRFWLECGVDVPVAAVAAPRLIAAPNPFTTSTTIWCPNLGTNASGTIAHELRVLDARGSVIRKLPARSGAYGWDGRDARGKDMPAGMYFVLPTPGSGEALRVVRRP